MTRHHRDDDLCRWDGCDDEVEVDAYYCYRHLTRIDMLISFLGGITGRP